MPKGPQEAQAPNRPPMLDDSVGLQRNMMPASAARCQKSDARGLPELRDATSHRGPPRRKATPEMQRLRKGSLPTASPQGVCERHVKSPRRTAGMPVGEGKTPAMLGQLVCRTTAAPLRNGM